MRSEREMQAERPHLRRKVPESLTTVKLFGMLRQLHEAPMSEATLERERSNANGRGQHN
jgi:hypothetical protein